MPKHSPEAKEAITSTVLEAMREGSSLRQACIEAGVSVSCFMVWVGADAAIQEQYIHAREALMDKMADDILKYADEAVGMTDNGSTDSGAVQKQKLQVDARKWLLSKLAPKKYGEKVENTVVGAEGGPVQTFNVNFGGK
jgi:hypothetical protein